MTPLQIGEIIMERVLMIFLYLDNRWYKPFHDSRISISGLLAVTSSWSFWKNNYFQKFCWNTTTGEDITWAVFTDNMSQYAGNTVRVAFQFNQVVFVHKPHRVHLDPVSLHQGPQQRWQLRWSRSTAVPAIPSDFNPIRSPLWQEPKQVRGSVLLNFRIHSA